MSILSGVTTKGRNVRTEMKRSRDARRKEGKNGRIQGKEEWREMGDGSMKEEDRKERMKDGRKE